MNQTLIFNFKIHQGWIKNCFNLCSIIRTLIRTVNMAIRGTPFIEFILQPYLITNQVIPQTDPRCACYVLPPIKKLVTFLFWTAEKTNYISKCLDFQKKLIDIITTSNFYLKFKENNENDMAAQVFWAVFYSSWRPSQIGPTADFDGAAIPPPNG